MELLNDIKELSYEDLRSIIHDALNPQGKDMAMPMRNCEPYRWIEALYPDRVIVEVDSHDGEPETYYEIPYTVAADDTVTFGTPVQVEQVYRPVATAGKAEDGKVTNVYNFTVSANATPDELLREFEALKALGRADGQMHIGNSIAEGSKATKTEGGVAYPASDFAVVPDPEKPSDWKLRLSEGSAGNITKAQLGRAAAALSPGGFRGNPVQLTDAERAAAKKRIRAEYTKLDVAEEDMPDSVKEVDEKAGQRMQGKMKSTLQAMSDTMSTMMGKLKELMSWANYEDTPADDAQVNAATSAKADDLAVGFKVIRSKETGELRWVSRSAAAFKDKDGEIFRTKALEEAVVEADKADSDRGPLMFWHVKGTEIGICDFQGVIGRFLVESGTFDNTPQAQKAASVLAEEADMPLEMSIGYQYKATDRADAIYDWLAIKERSICPPGAAANPCTNFATVKEVESMALNKQKEAFLVKHFGTEFVADLVTKTEQDSKELEKKLEFKADDTVDEREVFDIKAIAATIGEQLKPLVEGVKATSDTVASLQADLKAVNDRITKIEADRAADAEKVANAPRIAGLYTQRPSDFASVVNITQEEAEKAGLAEPQGTANPRHPLNRPVGVSR